MGNEFIASINSDKHFSLEKISEELCSIQSYVSEQNFPEVISFRFANKERRPDWPEDFRLCYYDGKLLLTIHISTRQEETKLIGDIQSVFSRHGISLTFEEI
jgi:hypothetical protein